MSTSKAQKRRRIKLYFLGTDSGAQPLPRSEELLRVPVLEDGANRQESNNLKARPQGKIARQGGHCKGAGPLATVILLLLALLYPKWDFAHRLS